MKEQSPQLTLLYRDRTLRSNHRRFCIRKLFLKTLQYPQETPVFESNFKRVVHLQTCNFIKKRTQHICFPVNIAEFLILPILKNICKRLLFIFSRVSDFRVQVTGLVFVFKLAIPVLKQVPTFIRKATTNTFDK